MEIFVEGTRFSLESVSDKTLNRWADKVRNLPQIASGAVSVERTLTWLTRVYSMQKSFSPLSAIDNTELILNRCRGFGGSEIGVLRANEYGEFHPFLKAAELVDEKLFKKLPTPPNAVTNRHAVLEALARVMFIEKYNATVNREAEQAITTFRGDKEHPWLIGNINNNVVIGSQSWTVDYKVPEDGGLEIEEPLLKTYSAQLHQYDMIAERAGHPSDGLLLVTLDIEPYVAEHYVRILGTHAASKQAILELGKNLAKSDIPGFRIVTHEIEKSPATQAELLSIGDKYWRHVLSGESLKVDLPEIVQMSSSEYDEFNTLARSLIATNRIRIEVEETEATLRKELTNLASHNKNITRGMKLPNKLVGLAIREHFDTERAAEAILKTDSNINRSALARDTKYSIDKLVNEVIRLGGNPDQCLEPGDFDKNAVQTALESLNIDYREYVHVEPSVQLTRARKGPAPAALERAGKDAKELTKSVIKKLEMAPYLTDKDLCNSDCLSDGDKSSSLQQRLL